MNRIDINENLIHFTKGKNDKRAEEIFVDILFDGFLKGGTGFIRGGHKCVCFTESSINALIKISSPYFNTYSPYGFMIKKDFIQEKGGSPVIYGDETRYSELCEKDKHLFVLYEITGQRKIDFTWENEWRLKTEELEFNYENVVLVVPNEIALGNIFDIINERLNYEVDMIETHGFDSVINANMVQCLLDKINFTKFKVIFLENNAQAFIPFKVIGDYESNPF
jgi:hypothetical protein